MYSTERSPKGACPLKKDVTMTLRVSLVKEDQVTEARVVTSENTGATSELQRGKTPVRPCLPTWCSRSGLRGPFVTFLLKGRKINPEFIRSGHCGLTLSRVLQKLGTTS